MANQNRRDFLKSAAAIGACSTGLATNKAKAEPRNILSDERMGVLVDTTVCVGCGMCEQACKIAHGFSDKDVKDIAARPIPKDFRRPDHKALTVVNQFENPKNPEDPINVKVQCMHCDHPACVSACIVGAFTKEENGTVLWDSDKCIGCRYCMVACPFQVPAFEFETAIHPNIVKCDFCFDRTKEGQLPACIEICPVEALTYGKLYDLHQLAHDKIKNYPERYVDHIFGDLEVGGTSWLYLSSKEFNELGFPKLSQNPAPGVSEAIQHGVFAYFVPPISVYALLGGVMWLTKNKNKIESE